MRPMNQRMRNPHGASCFRYFMHPSRYNLLICLCFISLGLIAVPFWLYIQQSEHTQQDPSTSYGSKGISDTNRTRAADFDEIQQLVHSHYPLNRLQCGNWTTRYMQLHKDILHGKAPQRYTVFRSRIAFQNGLADRLVSSVSIFLYALLTDRAFLYDWEAPSELWDYLPSSYIDWRFNSSTSQLAFGSSTSIGSDGYLMDYCCCNRDDFYCSGTRQEQFQSFFWQDDATTVGSGNRTVVWQTDRGIVFKAFSNPLLRPKLEALGLEQHSAFACLFDFLYRPTPEVLKMFERPLRELLDPAALKIGVQVRVGDQDDWYLPKGSPLAPSKHPFLFSHYFDCATQLEKHMARPGQRVIWYVLVDQPDLRGAFASKYGPKLLVNMDVKVEHIAKDVLGQSKHTALGFMSAVGELWTFSLTNVQVLTQLSGFGKVGAMLVGSPTPHTFSIQQPVNLFGVFGLDNHRRFGLFHRRQCTPQAADDVMQLCTQFTGI